MAKLTAGRKVRLETGIQQRALLLPPPQACLANGKSASQPTPRARGRSQLRSRWAPPTISSAWYPADQAARLPGWRLVGSPNSR